MATWGIDISNHQAGANLAKAKAAGASFVFAKATEGLTYTDDHFAGFRAQAKAAGLWFGAYHFARPQAGRTGVDEARHFLAVAGTSHDLPPVLDLEDTKLSSAATYAFALDWLTTVQKATSVRPIVYTYTAFAQQHLSGARNLAAYPLWLANYRPTPPPAPAPWSSWVAWQYTSNATVPGIPGRCDRNIAAPGFPGTQEDVMATLDDDGIARIAKAVWTSDGHVPGRSIWGEVATGTNRSQAAYDGIRALASTLPADTGKAVLAALSKSYDADVTLTPKEN